MWLLPPVPSAAVSAVPSTAEAVDLLMHHQRGRHQRQLSRLISRPISTITPISST
jgi:hypothetical protein